MRDAHERQEGQRGDVTVSRQQLQEQLQDNEASCAVAWCPPAVFVGYGQVCKQPHSLERAVQKQEYPPYSDT